MKTNDKTVHTIQYDEAGIKNVVTHLYGLFSNCKVFTFRGPLGAGKTTLIRALLQKAGVTAPIASPTFSYVNIYKNARGQTFFHFDLYRLRSAEDFFNAGFDEYFSTPNSWIFIEWPEIIWPALSEPVCSVLLDYADHERIAHIAMHVDQ